MYRMALALLLALVACGGPKKQTTEEEFPIPEGPPDAGAAATQDGEIPAELDAKVQHALEVIERVAVAVEGANGDCDKMAVDLKAIASGPDGKVVMEMDLDPEFQKHADAVGAKYANQLGKLGQRIGTAITACNTDGVNDALDEMGLGAQQ